MGAQGTLQCPGPSLWSVPDPTPLCPERHKTSRMQTDVMDGMAGGELLAKPTLERGGLQESLEWARASQPSSVWSSLWCLRNTHSGWDSQQCCSLQPACIHPHSHPHPCPRHSCWQPHPSVPSGAGYNGHRLPWLGNGGAAAPVLSSPGKRQLYIKNEGKTIQIS